MKILILEDDPQRVYVFYGMLAEHDLVVVNSANEAITLINDYKFNRIFLDHDLGGKVYVDSDEENTGYQVAKILPNSNNDSTTVVVHSWNKKGVTNMLSALKDHSGKVIVCPFEDFGKEILRK
jgi:CheY-like chemotaxis protein